MLALPRNFQIHPNHKHGSFPIPVCGMPQLEGLEGACLNYIKKKKKKSLVFVTTEDPPAPEQDHLFYLCADQLQQ